jgi:crotonobetainyl-CoA:carnitine CoA-transferase CaiB-like acyl-CoA transferase
VTGSVQPLRGIRVLDLGLGLSAAIAVKILADAGAEVLRLEPSQGDPFYEVYPAYRVWQQGKSVHKVNADALAQTLTESLEGVDLCVMGGEDFPGLTWRHDAGALRVGRERLVVLDIARTPAGWSGAASPSLELFAQARSGLVFEHYSDRPIMFAFAAASYGAALYGVAASLAALFARGQTGHGDVVSTSLLQGALRWCASLWLEAERPGPEFASLIPKDVVPLRLECADGVYVHITPGVPGTYSKLYEVLGIDDPSLDPNSRGSPTGGVEPRLYFGDVELMTRHARRWQSADLLEALWAKQLAVEAVLRPGECWDDPQTIHNGIIRRDAATGAEHVGNPFIYGATSSVESASPPRAAGGAPLSGVRVVDMGSFAAGPHASVILGDLGADVIKLERLEGDAMRPGIHHFAASSRGKRSIAVDAKSPEAMELIRRLCTSADIVHHNFRPGVSARLGVDAVSLRKINPAIIVLESLAYGPSGPKSLQSGFDSCFQAICGLESFPEGADNPPINYRIPIADYGTGTLGSIALMLAMIARQQALACNEMYTSLLNGGIFLLCQVVRGPDGSFTGAAGFDARHLGFHPAESLYQCSDGWIAIAARDAAMARRFAAAFDLNAVARVPRAEWGNTEAQALREAIARRSSADTLRILEAAEVWAVPCEREVGAALQAFSAGETGMVIEDDDPKFGRLRQIGRSVTFAVAELPREGRGRLDTIGGHTREILTECGYSGAEIDQLFERRIVA